MSDLGPDARRLLHLAEGADEPSPGDEARVRAKLALQLGAAVGLTTAAGAVHTAQSAGAGAAGTASTAGAASLLGKFVVGAMLLGAASGAAYVGLARQAPPPRPPQALTTPAAPTAIALPQGSPTPSLPASLAASSNPAFAQASAASTVAQMQSVQSTSLSSPSAASKAEVPKVEGASLASELELMHEAQVALANGDAQLALTKASEHQKRYPRGSLAPEREGTRVLALCALGRVDEARRAGQAFLGAYGKSPLADRVRHSCIDASRPEDK